MARVHSRLYTVNSMFDRPTPNFPNFPQSLLLCIPPLVAFAIAAYPISDWLIDDALISFAYARNFADGAGLVSQPGKVPVEGFSNPLWTFLFVPGFWLNPNVPLWSAKFLGHLFSFGTFFFGFHIVVRITRSPLLGFLAMTFLALNTSFVVWNVSGLENALYGFEIIALAYLGLLTLERLSWRVAVTAGLLAAAAALTRPDGLIFILLWPLALLVQTLCDKRLSAGALRPCLAYVGAAALPVIAYKAMTLVYFGDLFPNTYYAKGGPDLDTVLGILSLEEHLLAKGLDLFAAPFGYKWLTLGIFFIAFVLCMLAKRSVAPLVFLIGATVLALLTFILLPVDWMPEFRFGTPFLVLFYPTLFSLIWVAVASLPPSRLFSRQFPALLIVAVLAAASILVHQVRFARFYDEPTASHTSVSERYGERFNRAAEMLGVDNGSFLMQDMGGALFDSELEIIDLAGLTDATIARTLGKDKAALHDYIFNQVKPTFILTYRHAAVRLDLDSNIEFRRQYVPLRESVDPHASAFADRVIYSGAYVRRDVVEGRNDALARVRALLYGSP